MKAWGGCNQEETSPQKHCPGMQEWKVKTQNGNWWVMWKVTRRAFTSTVATRGRTSDIVGKSLTQGMHGADALSAFFISVFTGKVRFPELPCLVEGEMFYLQQQNIRVGPLTQTVHIQELMGPDGFLQSGHWETRSKPSQGCSLSSLRKHSNLVRSPSQEKR